MKTWQKVTLTWATLMLFCAVAAWAFSAGALLVTSVHIWGLVAAFITAGLGVACIWQERPHD